MIVGHQKPFEEIKASISDYRKVLVLGCGTCVSVCLTGGERQAQILASDLVKKKGAGQNQPTLEVKTIERQCERDLVKNFLNISKGTEAILSLACGAGVQTLVDVFRKLPVIPALNTTFLGALDEPGVWNEKCQGCGDCILTTTGGICPVARCAKRLLNGPCGGSSNGRCEISATVGRHIDCVWQLIIDRLRVLGKLDDYFYIRPPKDWSTETAKGPRRMDHTEEKVQNIPE